MKTKSTNEPYLTTAQRLTKALSVIADPVLRSELETVYALSNPITWARELLSLELPVELTRELLLIKVSQPPKSGRHDIEALLERAVKSFWDRMATDHAENSL